MDNVGGNTYLPDEDPFAGDVDRIELNLEGSDLNVLDSAQLDNLIDDEAKALNMGLDDSEIEKLMNPDNLQLGHLEGSDNSIDGLTSFPITEVEDAKTEQLLAPQTNMDMNSEYAQPSKAQMMQPDPILEGGSRQNMQHVRDSMAPMAQMNNTQQDHIQSMTMQGNALQRMVDDVLVHNDQTNMGNVPVNDGRMGGIDLEQEKMKLLSRLSEISERQQMPNHVQQQQQRQQAPQIGGGNMFLQNNNMMQRQQQRLSQPAAPAGVASLGGMTTSGETPLTSFLRRGQKKQPTSAAAATGRSMLSMNVAGAPKAASIFTESPMDFDNPLLKQKTPQQLHGAMDRTQLTQDMVRQMSASRLMGRTDSTKHIVSGGLVRQASNHGNAGWGEDNRTAYAKSSGILPRNASDNHLLTGAKASPFRNRSTLGSLSRENLLYSQMRKTSSKNQLQRDDSLGQLPTMKRRVSKHKLGGSRSVPHMMMYKSGSRGSLSGGGGFQKNAMW